MAYDSTSNNDYLIALVHNETPNEFGCGYIESDKPKSHKWLLRKPEIKCTLPICDVLTPIEQILTNLN